jgi:MYXO-CTERM domain-containing protein
MKKLMMIVAMVAVVAMASSAMASPILTGGGVYYDLGAAGDVLLDDFTTVSGSHDALTNGYAYSVGFLEFPMEGTVSDYMRGSGNTDVVKVTITGLTNDGQYDVQVLHAQREGSTLGSATGSYSFYAGLTTAPSTYIEISNTSPKPGSPWPWSYWHATSNPGAIGTATASGSGELDVYFAGTGDNDPRIDGIVLTEITPVIPEPAGLGLIGLALLAVRRKRSNRCRRFVGAPGRAPLQAALLAMRRRRS